MDDTTSVSTLREAVAAFIKQRNWEGYHTSKNLASSILIEAAELMEHFQWVKNDQGRKLLADPVKKQEIADELADVLIYTISFANHAQIDISQAVLGKLKKNESRFPKAG